MSNGKVAGSKPGLLNASKLSSAINAVPPVKLYCILVIISVNWCKRKIQLTSSKRSQHLISVQAPFEQNYYAQKRCMLCVRAFWSKDALGSPAHVATAPTPALVVWSVL